MEGGEKKKLGKFSNVSKSVVGLTKENKAAIVFENLNGLRNLYRKGNYQGKNFRARMNSVPWYEIKRQIEYKSAWEGVPLIQLTKGESRGTSKLCSICGERLQDDKFSKVHRRELWCVKCGRWLDRDVVAAMNISHKGCLRFVQSKGEAGEVMVQERERANVPLILKVDASKLSHHDRGKQLLKLGTPFRSMDSRTQICIFDQRVEP